ncbi:hypothetical protein [Yinghuangia seranimata]|uniref:hypothetical protein n=1 Tax=Yinghuangia seranimata TaxID=408067 RepID=UPI00248B7B11|nr:hypothetical protein [Yinghuangia seranimata]MDI2129815.1 hypothetical protein [Yinghuangia seranimata]
MTTPNELERGLTLQTAVARYEELRLRHAFADANGGPGIAPLARAEALELLALEEVIARKARYGRQLTVRTAREAGASWSQIGLALGTSKQAAWESHLRWIEEQAAEQQRGGYGTAEDAEWITRAHDLAGTPDEDGEDHPL